MRGLRPIVLLMMVSLLYSSSAALDPTGNDAGSGGDAGDGPDGALPIDFGSHEGLLTPRVDREDWYALELEAGTYLEVEWEPSLPDDYVRVDLIGPGPDGDPRYPTKDSPFGSLFQTIPTDGTWYLRIWLAADPVPPQQVPYTLQVSGELHPSFFTKATSAGSYVIETSFEKSDSFFFSIRQDLHEHSTTRAGEMGFVLQGHLDWGGDSRSQSHSKGVWGHKIQFPDRVESGGAVPPTDVPVLIQTDSGVDRHQLNMAFTNISGWLRVYFIHSHHEVWTEIVTSSTGALTAAGAEGGPVTSWTTKDLADGDDILLPGYAQTDGGQLEEDVSGAYTGLFLTRDNPGRAIAPNGTTYEAGSSFDDRLWLIHPDEGQWTFELDHTERLSDAPDELFYMGAPFPHLGLTPEPTEHCPKGPHCD